MTVTSWKTKAYNATIQAQGIQPPFSETKKSVPSLWKVWRILLWTKHYLN